MATEEQLANRKRIFEKAKAYVQMEGEFQQSAAGNPRFPAGCGSPRCILGWAERVLVDEGADAKQVAHSDWDMLKQATGLTASETWRIYSGSASQWPEPFRDRYQVARYGSPFDKAAQVEAAADFCQYIADGGEL